MHVLLLLLHARSSPFARSTTSWMVIFGLTLLLFSVCVRAGRAATAGAPSVVRRQGMRAHA